MGGCLWRASRREAVRGSRRSQRLHACLSPVRSCLWRGRCSLLRAGRRAGGALLRLLCGAGAADDESHHYHAPHRRLPRPSWSCASSWWTVVAFVLYRRRRSRPSLSSSSVVVVHRRRPTTTFPTAPCCLNLERTCHGALRGRRRRHRRHRRRRRHPTMTTTTTATRKSGSLHCSSVVLDFLCCPGSYSFRLQCAPRGGASRVAARAAHHHGRRH